MLKVTLGVSDLRKSISYWSDLLGMKIYEKDEEKQRALLGYADNQVSPGKFSKCLRVTCHRNLFFCAKKKKKSLKGKNL